MPTFLLFRPLIALLLAQAIAAPSAPRRRIDDAAARHRVNALVLRAIGWHESRLQPAAVGRNANGSVDVGAFQINSVHWRRAGAPAASPRTALTDGCVGAGTSPHGTTVARSTCRATTGRRSRPTTRARAARAAWYANQVAAILMRWNVMPRGAPPFPANATLAPGQPPQARPVAPSAPPSGVAPPFDRGGGFDEIAYLPSAR